MEARFHKNMKTTNSVDTYHSANTGSEVYKKFKPSTWIFWVLAHTIAFPFAMFLGFLVAHLLSFTKNLLPEIIASGPVYILWGIIYGGAIGLIQWLFLRKRTSINHKGWFFYSALGMGAAEFIGITILLILGMDRNIDIGLESNGWMVWSVINFAGGLITGYFQSLYLKNITPFYKVWILGSALSWGLGTLAWTGMIYTFEAGYFLILGGIFLGLLSAIFLHYIFKNTSVPT
jgi:hypothetical protein